MIAPLCAYKRAHDRAYVYIYLCKWLCACVHMCIHAWAWLRLCVHIRAGMIAPMCAHMCRHDCAYVRIYVQAWSCPMCAYSCRHDCTYVCIQAWAWSRLCVHIHAGMIAPMCAYRCGHDCAYVCIYVHAWLHICNMWACGDENIKSKQDKTKCEQLERLDTVYAHMCTGMYMYHSWTQSQASSLGIHGNNQARPCTSHVLAQAASEQQCRSQAIMPRLSGRAARWFTKTVASWKGSSWPTHAQQVFEHSSIMHAYKPDHKAWVFLATIRRVLAHTMLWNRQHRHSNEDISDESKTFKQVVHTSCIEQHKHKQRMPAHLTFLLGLYLPHLLHQKHVRQLSVHWIWHLTGKSWTSVRAPI